jgi:hypothetical protein
MSARQAAMLGCNNNIFSNKINYSCIAVELKTIVKGSQIEKGPKHLASFLVSQIHNLSHAESLFESLGQLAIYAGLTRVEPPMTQLNE